MVSEEAYATETLDDGIAYVKVTSPGVWVVRVEKRIRNQRQRFRPSIAQGNPRIFRSVI